jgi:hypothetical protein
VTPRTSLPMIQSGPRTWLGPDQDRCHRRWRITTLQYQTFYYRPEHNTGTHTKSQIKTIAGPDRARRTTSQYVHECVLQSMRIYASIAMLHSGLILHHSRSVYKSYVLVSSVSVQGVRSFQVAQLSDRHNRGPRVTVKMARQFTFQSIFPWSPALGKASNNLIRHGALRCTGSGEVFLFQCIYARGGFLE